MSTEKAVAVSTGHEFGHLLGVGDFPYYDWDAGPNGVKLTDMRNIMENENPIRSELNIPLRLGYGDKLNYDAPGMSDSDIINYIRDN